MIFFLLESIKQAYRALLSNKVRSFLTMLGVIIGIFSVITLVTIGEGAKTYITDQIKTMGAGYDSFIVVAGKDANTPPSPKFVYGDISFLKARLPEIKDIVALNPSSGDIYFGKKKFKATVIFGTTANYLDLMGGKLIAGRFMSVPEVESRRKVAIVGPKVADELFNGISPIGEKIKIKGVQYLIIGVTEARGNFGPIDMDKRVIIPITTAKNMMGNDKIMRFNIFPKDTETIEETQKHVAVILERRIGSDDFRILNQKGILSIVNNILAALTGFVTGLAAISLLVGGIGIMNIMLVAVNERVREIGVRKAIGARRQDIVLQFLVEAMLISLLGGIIGIILG
ncbi:MAG: hypothetical protein A2484_10255, partial [Nitrospirae bacterium RIFOXYC2_FULL_44_7]